MKKLITLSLSIAICASAYADSTRLLTVGNGIPGPEEPQLMAMGISPDGKYVCGTTDIGMGYFIADLISGKVAWSPGDPDEEDNQLRNVDNNGLAIGISSTGITYSIDDELTILDTPEGNYRSVIGEDLTNDGSLIVGSLVTEGHVTHAAYCKMGEDWKLLPNPTEEQLCGYPLKAEDSSAKYVSADGKIIFGLLGSFEIPVLWILNDEGEYEVDFFPVRYIKLTEEDRNNEEKVLYAMSGMYFNMSNNGRYVSLIGMIYDDNNNQRTIPVIYDTVEKKMTYYMEQQAIDEDWVGLIPTAISDDGTFIGTIGLPIHGCYGTFIMQAGQTQAKTLVEAFPSYAKIFSVAESIGECLADGISADGQYICGYSFYCEDYFDDVTPAYYVTFVIDTKGVSEVIDSSVVDSQATPIEYFSIDGKRLGDNARGFKIVRMSDGSVRKVMTR